jgi:hypothetical protein
VLLLLLLQIVFIVICILKAISICWLCYKAYLPFHKIVVTNKFVQSGSVPNSPGNANGANAQSPQNGTTALLRTATTTPTKDARGSLQGSITTISVASTTGL